MQLSLGNLDGSPSQHCYSFPKNIINPKGLGGSLSFQFSRMFVVASGRSISHSRAKTFRAVELKVTGTGSKFFHSGPLRMIVNRTVPFSIP